MPTLIERSDIGSHPRMTWRLVCSKREPRKREYVPSERKHMLKFLVRKLALMPKLSFSWSQFSVWYVQKCFFPKVKADRTSLDELIRQCTVESPERGLLLLRVRDEMRIIVAAYQVLYESSLAYAVRKGLHAEVQRLEAQLLVSLKLNDVLTLTTTLILSVNCRRRS